MPTVRVFLRCATPTNRPGGMFDTFINVSDKDYERGQHLRIARSRAKVLGYRGRYLVVEVRVLTPVPAIADPSHRASNAEPYLHRMQARLAAAVDDAERANRSALRAIVPASSWNPLSRRG